MQTKNFRALFAPLMLLPATFLLVQSRIKKNVTNDTKILSDSRGSGRKIYSNLGQISPIAHRGSGRNVSIDLGQQPPIKMAYRGSGRNVAYRGSGRNVAYRGFVRNVA
jgi:hypothetical protein